MLKQAKMLGTQIRQGWQRAFNAAKPHSAVSSRGPLHNRFSLITFTLSGAEFIAKLQARTTQLNAALEKVEASYTDEELREYYEIRCSLIREANTQGAGELEPDFEQLREELEELATDSANRIKQELQFVEVFEGWVAHQLKSDLTYTVTLTFADMCYFNSLPGQEESPSLLGEFA